ncbi:MAG: hypothetical protein Q8S31_10675 [Alphaproteobacteria bacterium]|nr:hypothetical protein [Alphaproteobacteria bacterium]
MKKYIIIFSFLAISLPIFAWEQDITPQIQKVLSVYDPSTGQTIPYSVYIQRQQLEENRRHKNPAHQYAHHCFMKKGVRICHPKKEDCYYSKFGRQCWPKQEFGGVLPEPVPAPEHKHPKRRSR